LALVGQTQLRAVQSSASFENALVAYVRYLGKFFVPVNLAVPYPMQPVSELAAVGAAALLVAITVVVWRWLPARIGWLWFIGTLVPVIGIVQIGVQAMADRYTYFPYIGLTVAVAYTVRRLPLAAFAVVPILAFLSFRQTGYWKNSETLFTHTIAVTPPNAMAEFNLGNALEMSEPDRAIQHFKRAIELQHDFTVEWYPQVWVGMGVAHLVKAQRMPPGHWRTEVIRYSIDCNRRALELDPKTPHAANNLKVGEQMLGR
jgi:protein O-mannosyl-transferase